LSASAVDDSSSATAARDFFFSAAMQIAPYSVIIPYADEALASSGPRILSR
jgi:hypothetical protein